MVTFGVNAGGRAVGVLPVSAKDNGGADAHVYGSYHLPDQLGLGGREGSFRSILWRWLVCPCLRLWLRFLGRRG